MHPSHLQLVHQPLGVALIQLCCDGEAVRSREKWWLLSLERHMLSYNRVVSEASRVGGTHEAWNRVRRHLPVPEQGKKIPLQ